MNATAEKKKSRRTRSIAAVETNGAASMSSSHSEQSDTVAAQPRGAAVLSKREFPHLRQRYDWDCGLVCCQMALKWVQRAQPFAAIARRCPTQSTWSIDLAYLLQVPLIFVY